TAQTDVCESPPPPPELGDADYCSAAAPCVAGGGDCDSDAECQLDLVCTADVGANYGFTPQTDVCEPPPCSDVILQTEPPAAAAVGSLVQVNARATCPGEAEYEFWVDPPGGPWTGLQAWSSAATLVWDTTDAAQGTYELRVRARHAGRTSYDAQAQSTYTLTTPCTEATLEASRASPTHVGLRLNLVAGANGCPSPDFEFRIRRAGGSWEVIRSWAAQNVYALGSAGLEPGLYEFEVRARDASSVQDYDAVASVNHELAAALPPRCSAPVGPDAHPAQLARQTLGPVMPLPGDNGTFLIEAEELSGAGWTPRAWGTNYYSATVATTYLSRKAYLEAPEQAEQVIACVDLDVPSAGRYLALARYEAPYRFSSQFRVRIEQGEAVRLDRMYGTREATKIWAFGKRLQPEVLWSYGATENIVWEGHDTYVDLDAGPAVLSLIADAQPEPAARRNVDAILLTTDEAQVESRIATESFLPLDGWLTQADDLYLRVHNDAGSAPLALTVDHGIEHSPYWIHQRTWSALKIALEPEESSDWLEVGHLLDALNDGEWHLRAASGSFPHYRAEFGTWGASAIEPMAEFEVTDADHILAYEGDTRYSQRIRPQTQVLYALLDRLRLTPQNGRVPTQTPVFAASFVPHPDDATYTAARDEFYQNMGFKRPELANGYINVRGYDATRLQTVCEDLTAQGVADQITSVSLGDEIALKSPSGDSDTPMREYLQSQGVTPEDVVPGAGEDWSQVRYDPSAEAAAAEPATFYYSSRYKNQFGIDYQADLTSVLEGCLPNAGIGANYSPGEQYVGAVVAWVSMFRQGAMTMPWSEDYSWLMPFGSPQMNSLGLDMFRAGLRERPSARIQYYVMAHSPGNSPRNWRRQFYSALLHGMKIVNAYEMRPVQASYSGDYVNDPEMYLAVRRGIHELGTFEDIVQPGQLRPGRSGLWFSEASDIWGDRVAPFLAAKRSLYVAIRHQQLPLDVLVDDDATSGVLDDYQVLYLADRHVSRAASEAIAQWVREGGQLLATAGAGMFDELDQPNTALREILGVDEQALDVEQPALRYIKQDLPFALPLDTVTWRGGWQTQTFPIYSARSHVRLAGARPVATFDDGSAAITSAQVGRGRTTYCGFLPGLSYFAPAVPRRPVDRGGTNEDAFTFFIPTEFSRPVARLVGLPAAHVRRDVLCSEPLVESGLIESDSGAVIPLVNFGAGPVERLRVSARLAVSGRPTVTLASGQPVSVRRQGRCTWELTLDLDVADALVVRVANGTYRDSPRCR
ncbi:MAG: beta-galactosidase trimerization domain-containing protein, partial [Polyangiaceae bacterium]|nr:beta-galactosidase trimerization domain-containing protein [Polyangiaceae bacterium]